uniref:Uncharacterized protein n=1 Tax=Zea mays TaxID=4577 RepID=B6TQB6_MAIZE|nr:hypothetical protein [Zea mays]
MSEYKNVVGGRLKLKGKALDVKEGGVKKKKKKHQLEESSQIEHDELHKGGNSGLPADHNNELIEADASFFFFFLPSIFFPSLRII